MNCSLDWQLALNYLATRDRVMANLIASYPHEVMLNNSKNSEIALGNRLQAVKDSRQKVKFCPKSNFFKRKEKLMGEAKRRKKLLGKDYGEYSPVLVKGSNQFEKHFQKFRSAWTEKLEALGDPSELGGQELKAKRAEMQQWLHDYLSKYQTIEREKLVMEVINPLYEELLVAAETEKDEAEWSWQWLMEALSLYETFKPYLSALSAQLYARPLIDFYETVIREEREHPPEEVELKEKLEKLKQKFEEVLEIEESKRVG